MFHRSHKPNLFQNRSSLHFYLGLLMTYFCFILKSRYPKPCNGDAALCIQYRMKPGLGAQYYCRRPWQCMLPWNQVVHVSRKKKGGMWCVNREQPTITVSGRRYKCRCCDYETRYKCLD